MHRSLLKQFPCLFGFCLLVSSVSNFCPDTGGPRWSLVQVASSLVLRGGRGTAFSVYAAQAPGCSIWSMPCAACGSSPPVLHKSVDLAAPAFSAFPTRVAQAARSLRGALSPGAARLLPSTSPAPVPPVPHPQPQSPPVPVGCLCPVSRRDPPGGCRPCRISGGLWLETGGLFAVR